MFEIEKMEQEFDYSLVDNKTADFLRSCEYEMNGIAEDARVKFGGVLKKAQDKLSNHYKGTFRKWFESGGLDKNDVYYSINLFESSRNLDNTKKENFLNAPKTLQKEVMKKNAPEELKEQVFSGDIRTNKKYKEMERQLKQSQESEKIAISQLEKEQEQEPERIEVVPDDYDYIKGNFEEAQKMREHYKEQLEEMREELKNSSEHKKIDTSEMERLERREETLKNKVSTYDKLYDIQTDLENILSVIHKKSHSLNVKSIKDEYVIIGEVDGTLNEVIKVCNELKVNLQNKNIIEGEIVNG